MTRPFGHFPNPDPWIEREEDYEPCPSSEVLDASAYDGDAATPEDDGQDNPQGGER